MREFLANNKKLIIGIVAIIIVAILIKRNWWKVQRVLNPVEPNDSPEGLSSEAKGALEDVAQMIYTDIYDTSTAGHFYEPYKALLGTYDDYIVYAAKYYKSHLADGNSMAEDIYTQWYATDGTPLNLRLKLKELGQN